MSELQESFNTLYKVYCALEENPSSEELENLVSSNREDLESAINTLQKYISSKS